MISDDEKVRKLVREVAFGSTFEADSAGRRLRRLRKRGVDVETPLGAFLRQQLIERSERKEVIGQLAQLLTDLRVTRSFPLLFQVSKNGGPRPLNDLILALRGTPQAEDIRVLLEELARAAEWPHAAEYTLVLLRLLVTLAELNPLPELRQLYPYLQFQLLSTPVEYLSLQKRLRAALKGDALLPIPAMPSQPTRDLPIPIEKEE